MFLIAPRTSKSMTLSQTLLDIKIYNLNCFFRILKLYQNETGPFVSALGAKMTFKLSFLALAFRFSTKSSFVQVTNYYRWERKNSI